MAGSVQSALFALAQRSPVPLLNVALCACLAALHAWYWLPPWQGCDRRPLRLLAGVCASSAACSCMALEWPLWTSCCCMCCAAAPCDSMTAAW